MNFVINNNIDRYDGIFFNKKNTNIFDFDNIKLYYSPIKKKKINDKKIKGILKKNKNSNKKNRIKFKNDVTVHKISFKDKSHISTNNEYLKGKRPDEIDNIIGQIIISIINIPNYRTFNLEILIGNDYSKKFMISNKKFYYLIVARLIAIYYHLDVYEQNKIVYAYKSFRVKVKQKKIILKYLKYQTNLFKNLRIINRFYYRYIRNLINN